MHRLALALLLSLIARPALAWTDTIGGRLQVEAVIQTLRAELLSHDSATEVLAAWCADHRLADPPRIVARRLKAEAPALPAADRALLGVGAGEPLAFRHVELVCGARVLSVADNWYVPARLTVEMNRALQATDAPFGEVVRPLHFQRRTLSSEVLFRALPRGWEAGAAPPIAQSPHLEIGAEILRHKAVLVTPDGRPFSLVVETYQAGLLAFEPPPAP
jgi:hypothetical protein